MNFDEFKEAAKRTGIRFNKFFKTSFLRATSIETGISTPVFVAEIAGQHITLYYPNNRGGATLVKGFGKDREILFFNEIDEIRAE